MSTPTSAPPVLCKERHGGYCRQPVTSPTFACRYPSHNIGRAHVYGQLTTSAATMRTKFEANATAGARGEQEALKVLLQAFGKDPSVYVFIDRRAPTSSYTFNIDFVIVRDRNLLVVDAKQWSHGTYWSLRKLVHRGWQIWKPFEGLAVRDTTTGHYTPSRTMEFSLDLFRQALAKRTDTEGNPEQWTVNGAYLVVPASQRPDAWRAFHLRLWRAKGAKKLVAGHPSTPRRLRDFVGTTPPQHEDESVLKWLSSLNTRPVRQGR